MPIRYVRHPSRTDTVIVVIQSGVAGPTEINVEVANQAYRDAIQAAGRLEEPT